jgi:nicotinate-nucleotide adenylyltransferase
MTRLACEDNPLFEVSDIEIGRADTSYTVNTLEYFSGIRDRESYFIMGTDSLREIRTWKDYEKLFTLSHFIVVTRPGLEFEASWSEVPAELRAGFRFNEGRYEHRSGTRLIASETVGLDISSTGVRDLSRAGRSIRYLVPDPVRAYIAQNRLYRCLPS